MKHLSLLSLVFLSISCSSLFGSGDTGSAETVEETSSVDQEQAMGSELDVLDDQLQVEPDTMQTDVESTADLALAPEEQVAYTTPAPAPVEQSAPVASTKREVASSRGFFANTLYACPAHTKASAKSAKIKNISSGRKIWAERSGDSWYKIFLKSTHAFVQKACLDK